MIVDPDAERRRAAAAALGEFVSTIELAAGLSEALPSVVGRRVSLALIHRSIGEADCLSLLRCLRAEGGTDAAFVLVRGALSSEEQIRFREAGADDVEHAAFDPT